jgi:hypothetical protein
VWLNDGTGTFSDSGQDLGSESGFGVALGDLDGDGDLDAFVPNYSPTENRVWMNNGASVFSSTNQLIGNSSSFAVALGDLDGDKDLDAFVANIGATGEQANKVWLNEDVSISGLSAGNDGPTPFGQTTYFSATVATGTGVTYTWDLGDGTFAAGTSVTYVYPTVGTYTAVVTASNDVSVLTDTTSVTITDAAITGLVATNDSPTPLGKPTYLTATLDKGTNVSYNWDLGDGSMTKGDAISHTYALAGTYTATITTTNSVSTMMERTIVTVLSLLPEHSVYLLVILRPN